jgi:hypothetical protein
MTKLIAVLLAAFANPTEENLAKLSELLAPEVCARGPYLEATSRTEILQAIKRQPPGQLAPVTFNRFVLVENQALIWAQIGSGRACRQIQFTVTVANDQIIDLEQTFVN